MKKLAIVAPHFPPSALPPSQRVRMIVPKLRDEGWECTVFTVEHKCREEKTDLWMNELIGNDYDLIKVKCFDAKKTRKFGIGDLGLRMLPFLLFSMIKNLRKSPVDCVLYPVPPWYILVIAPIVKWFTKTPYVIDFIDPWVNEQVGKDAGMKKKISQWVAVKLEKWVTSNASGIYSVSDAINKDLVRRHPSLASQNFAAIPYGVDFADFKDRNIPTPSREIITMRYIGAVWSPALPVLDILFRAIKSAADQYNDLRVEFIGTSYAGEGLAKPSLTKLTDKYSLDEVIQENPLRVPYKEAVRLALDADILFLFGDTSKQYAASKLMGLIASEKPFIAFLNKESYPYQFLNKLNYPYLVGYIAEQVLDVEQSEMELTNILQKVIEKRNEFIALEESHPLIEANTARGMTKRILELIEIALKEKN